jgi:hypothetical protein
MHMEEEAKECLIGILWLYHCRKESTEKVSGTKLNTGNSNYGIKWKWQSQWIALTGDSLHIPAKQCLPFRRKDMQEGRRSSQEKRDWRQRA